MALTDEEKRGLDQLRRDRDQALDLVQLLQGDLERLRAENLRLLARVGAEQIGRERAVENLVEDLQRRLARLERGGAA